MTLKPKQRRFVDEYLKDSNGAQAAIRAGYSAKTARAIASELLTFPHVKAAIEERLQKVAAKADVTAEYVLSSLKEIVERTMQRVPVMVGQGKDRQQAVDEDGNGVWEFDSMGANAALKMLGQHLALFTEKVQHSADQDLVELIRRARKARNVQDR